MEINNLKTLSDYVNGESIETDIDDLENDSLFMKKVLFYTRDKKMYNFCSDNLKGDYFFVKSVIKMFKNDLDFILNISKNYFALNENLCLDDINTLELKIHLRNLLKNNEKYENDYNKLCLSINAAYQYQKVRISLFDTAEQNQMGFIYFIDFYGESKTILDYVAERFIDEILEDVDFERRMHKIFKTKERLVTKGVSNAIIEWLTLYDESLSSYVSSNMSLISSLKSKTEKILKRWEIYERQLEDEIFSSIYSQIDSYIFDKDNIYPFFRDKIIKMVAKEFNVQNEMIAHDPYYENEVDEEELILYRELEKSVVEEEFKKFSNIFEQEFYIFLKKVFKEVFDNDKILYDSYIEKNKKSRKCNLTRKPKK